MAIYFSAQNGAFYDSTVISVNDMPSDKVEVSAAQYEALLAEQNNGKIIIASGNNPASVNQTCGTCSHTLHELVTASNTVLGHVKADNSTITSASGVISVKSGNFVRLTGNESIAGTKTFSAMPQVPTAAAGDSSANAASTKFVQQEIDSIQIDTGLFMPDYSAGVDITSTLRTYYVNNNGPSYSYTPPKDGVIKVFLHENAAIILYKDRTTVTDYAATNAKVAWLVGNGQDGIYTTSYMLVSKGQTVYAYTQQNWNDRSGVYFYPLKGAL